MIRTVALFVSLSILASCATPSTRPAEPVQPPASKAPDPRICAAVRATPRPPSGASIVQPATVEERAATSLFLNWVADLIDVAGQNEARARLAQAQACGGL